MNTTLCIEVTAPNGSSQLFTVEGEHARLGSAAHCEVRLPLGESAPEQIALQCQSDGVLAKALATLPEARIDGKPFSEQTLRSDSVLEIGAARVRVFLREGVKSAGKGDQRKSSPLAYLAIPFLIAYAISELPHGAKNEDAAPSEAPALFAPPAPCPETRPESALAFGRERRRLADSKRERRPFHAADGVRAVELYRLSATCFESGADPQAATEAHAAAVRLQTDLEESYRTHRVRLEHALSISDALVARHEARALLDLTTGASGDYVVWLRNLERRLKLQEENET